MNSISPSNYRTEQNINRLTQQSERISVTPERDINHNFNNSHSDFDHLFSSFDPAGSPISKRILHCLARFMAGHIAAAIMSLITVWIGVFLAGSEAVPFVELIGITLFARWIVAFAYKSRRALVTSRLRLKREQVWRDALYFSTIFLAATFVLGSPISREVAAIILGVNILGQLAIFNISRFILKLVARKPSKNFQKCAVIIGNGKNAQKIADTLLDYPELDTRPIGFLSYHSNTLWRYRDIPLIGHPNILERLATHGQIDALFVALDSQDLAHSAEILKAAERMGIPTYCLPNFFQPSVARLNVAHLNGYLTLAYETVPRRDLQITIKDLMDRFGALVGIVLFCPIMLAAAAAIKIESKGPVLFKQTRSGRHGRKFSLYKFRSMIMDAEQKKNTLLLQNEMSGPVFKIKNDPRVTRVGKFLRKYSIDELPQFFNILKGDMSLVGPRPPLPSEVLRFEPWQYRKLSVKPGLTCLWQVNGRNAIDFEDWMRLDLEYIDKWSLAMDTRILLKTFPTVLKGSGS